MRFNHLSKILIVSALCPLFFMRCAQVVPLSGGARDTKPPKLLETIPANRSVNFNADEVVMRFDEFIQLKDLRNQLIISPTLKNDPEIVAGGKKLKIVLKKEDLLPGTTYRFYFGKAVADMREGNPIQGFEYVFSTGNNLDTTRFEGKVFDAFQLNAVSDVLVGLYNTERKNDSLIFKRPPDYITKSDGSGNFSFSWLPPKKFTLVAFTDKNKNLLYDGESEKVGFRPEEVDMKVDTGAEISIFQEVSSKLFIKKTMAPYYGKTMVIYNRKSKCRADLMNGISRYEDFYETQASLEKDTVTIYYKDAADTIRFRILHSQPEKVDTIVLPVPKLKINKKKSLQFTNNVSANVLPWKTPLQFTFYNMIDSSKTKFEKMRLVYNKDTVEVEEPLLLKFTEPNKCRVMNKMDEGKSYRIKMDSAVIFDYQGRYNDSVLLNFKTQSLVELGRITLKMLLNKKQAYIVQLLSERDVVMKEEYVSLSLSSSNATNIEFRGVKPAVYKVKVIFDDNGNKRWDSGNYLRAKQPEKVFISSKQIKALPDWDVEEEILVK